MNNYIRTLLILIIKVGSQFAPVLLWDQLWCTTSIGGAVHYQHRGDASKVTGAKKREQSDGSKVARARRRKQREASKATPAMPWEQCNASNVTRAMWCEQGDVSRAMGARRLEQGDVIVKVSTKVIRLKNWKVVWRILQSRKILLIF